MVDDKFVLFNLRSYHPAQEAQTLALIQTHSVVPVMGGVCTVGACEGDVARSGQIRELWAKTTHLG